MEISKKSITEFMERYFGAYYTIAQDPKENYRMAEYFSPDLVVTVYLGDIDECGREEFLRRISSHPGIQETLTPKHMVIDEAQGMLAVLLHCGLTVQATGDLVREVWFSAHYKFKLDEKKALTIEHLWLFAQYARPGEKSIFDV
jgi:hypothetical protein